MFRDELYLRLIIQSIKSCQKLLCTIVLHGEFSVVHTRHRQGENGTYSFVLIVCYEHYDKQDVPEKLC